MSLESIVAPAASTSGTPELPGYVQAAFGARDEPVPVRLGGVSGWRCGEVLVRPVADAAVAAWAAGVLDGLSAEGLRLARPVRSSDGRWVVSGYSACRHLAGSPEPRHDDAVAASLLLHVAMVGVRRPRLLDELDDLATRASTAAWGDQRIAMDPAAGGELFDRYAQYRRPVSTPNQVVHGELFGTLLFAEGEPPAVLDLVPFWRPPQWAAAVVVIDALAWGGADAGWCPAGRTSRHGTRCCCGPCCSGSRCTPSTRPRLRSHLRAWKTRPRWSSAGSDGLAATQVQAGTPPWAPVLNALMRCWALPWSFWLVHGYVIGDGLQCRGDLLGVPGLDDDQTVVGGALQGRPGQAVGLQLGPDRHPVPIEPGLDRMRPTRAR